MDKIKGGWAGKTIGCTYGGPTEFVYRGTWIQDYTPIQWPDHVIKWYFDHAGGLYDDVYMDLTFVDVFDRLGLDAPTDSFAKAFAYAPYPLWHANLAARENIKHGIMPPLSGHWKNNQHADDIDFQIEADFAGLMSPGLPVAAAGFADRIGHIMNYGDGWYGGVYVATLLSLAFVSNDIGQVVGEAVKAIPSQSRFHQCMSDIIAWHRLYPGDWHRTWWECQKKYGQDRGCPDGVFMPFDIDALINSAYVTIGLLYGNGDFSKSMEIATRCGQDSDCNPSTVAGILGTMLGYHNIPERWMANLLEVEDRPFAYTDIPLSRAYRMSFDQALKVISRNGGKVRKDEVVIPVQRPKAVRYEQSFEGFRPVDFINVGSGSQAGAFSDRSVYHFTGSGIVATVSMGGNDAPYEAQVLVSIDGKPYRKVNVGKYTREAITAYDLEEGPHTINFRWLNRNNKVRLSIDRLLVYSRAQ